MPKSDSDYEPDQEELARYSKRARKQTHFNASMFFDSDDTDDDTWFDPRSRGGVRSGRPRSPRPPSVPLYSSDSDDLTSVDMLDCERIPDPSRTLPKPKEDMYSAWNQFMAFSQFSPTKQELEGKHSPHDMFHCPWNPYKADLQKVGIYLKVLEKSCKYNMKKLAVHFEAISKYLVGLDGHSVGDLVNKCKLDVAQVPRRLIRRMDYKGGVKVPRVWHDFADFCHITATADPFLAEPEHLANFIVGALLLRDKSSDGPQRENFLRPFIDFFTENVLLHCKYLKFYLKLYHIGGDSAIMDSDPIKKLLEAARSLDRKEEPLSSDLAARLRPPFWYTEYRAREHSKTFWQHGLVRRVVNDVKNKVISLAAAAWQLGVPPNMVMASISKDGKDEEVDFTIGQYLDMGFGSEEQFWEESSTSGLLEEVRCRKVEPDTAAFQLGVSGRKLLEVVGEIKTEEQIQEEKDEEKREKIKNKAPKVKQMNQLEKEIARAEENEDDLSEYEKMRLRNMRERQEMMEMLNFEEDQKEMAADKPAIKPKDYGVRDKSSRIKRKAEEAEIKSQLGVSKSNKPRQSPEWVGRWTPVQSRALFDQNSQTMTTKAFTEKAAALSSEELTSVLPVPPYDLELQEVYATNQNHHRANRFLERLQGELRDWSGSVEPRISAPVWGVFEQAGLSSKVCETEILSVATWEDLVCWGDQAGGVGVNLGGRCLSLQPHSQAVSRVVFAGTEERSGLSLISASLDSTVRVTDLVTQQVSLERDLGGGQGREVRWLESVDSNCWLVNLDGREVRQVDRREKGAGAVVRLAQEVEEGSSIGRHPTLPHVISVCEGQAVCVFDLRQTKQAQQQFKHDDQEPEFIVNFAGSNWSRVSGKYLLGCETKYKLGCQTKYKTPYETKYKVRQSPVVWEYKGSKESPVLEWPDTRAELYLGTSFSRFYGANWCPWSEEVVLTTASRRGTGPANLALFGQPVSSVVAIDVSSGSVLADLTGDLSHSPYVIECHLKRPEVVVGNSAGLGYLASFKFSS